MTLMASCNTILQTILIDDMRGRVMSFFTMSIIGIAPFGCLGAGAMAGLLGTRETLLLGASFCLLGAMLFARQLPYLREKVRPIYERLGIMGEAAHNGMESTAEPPPVQ
jgi:hypothetical protein